MKITHLNPDTLHKNPAFSQAVMVEGQVKTIYIGGQNAVDVDGKIIGKDLAAQAEQAFKNLLTALRAVGAAQQNVVKLTVYVVQGHALPEAFTAARNVWGPHASALTVLVVAGLANPQFLIEIEAVAVVES